MTSSIFVVFLFGNCSTYDLLMCSERPSFIPDIWLFWCHAPTFPATSASKGHLWFTQVCKCENTKVHATVERKKPDARPIIPSLKRCSSTSTHKKQDVNGHLVVESTHMQGSVSWCILGTHVSSVEQQVFQVLHVAISTCLKQQMRSNKPTTNKQDIHKVHICSSR